MTNGDRMRQMNNTELANEIWRWHEILWGNEFRSPKDIENHLSQKTEPKNIMEAAMDELFS